MSRAAEIAQRVDQELPDDADAKTVESFMLRNFAKDKFSDVEKALAILDEISRQDILEKLLIEARKP